MIQEGHVDHYYAELSIRVDGVSIKMKSDIFIDRERPSKAREKAFAAIQKMYEIRELLEHKGHGEYGVVERATPEGMK